MYQGGSKDTGAIVGRVGGGNAGSLELNDAQDMVGAEESLVGFDENGNEVVISAFLNPGDGEVTWMPSYNLEESKNKTVAMSQMTSMLRDEDRNNLFEQAIMTAISAFIEKHQRRPVVLDIGCGTGLLSLFAAKHGAEYVFAVEMFDAMANIAQNVIQANGYSDKIIVINAKSTDIDQLPCEVDLIISELLDSALLGESCLPSHADAIRRFLKKDDTLTNTVNNPYAIADRIIPNRGEVFATLIESIEVQSMVRVDSVTNGREPFNVYRNDYARNCHGGWPMIPVHWEALEHRGAKKLSDSVPCLQVSFADTHHNIYFNMMTNPEMRATVPQTTNQLTVGNHPIKSFDTEILVKNDGVVHGLLFWWKTYLLSQSLNPMSTLFYSTEPGKQNWQDHWQQIVFPLPEAISVRAGEILQLHVSHDDLSFWVNVVKVDPTILHHSISSSSSLSSIPSPVPSSARTVGLKRNREEHNVRILQNMIPRYYEESIDQKHSCICGWHLLHGCYQLLSLNYYPFNKTWDNLFDSLLDQVLQSATIQWQQAASNGVKPAPTLILDTSDGSIFSITFALKLKKKMQALFPPQSLGSDDRSSPSVHFITKERKQFSGIFFSQLISANDLEDMVTVWDGNLDDLPGLLQMIVDGEAGNNENDDDEMNDDSVNSPTGIHDINHSDKVAVEIPPIPLVLHNCFSYQLQSLPVWEAISFYYQRIALQTFLSPTATILPGKAVVMALPLELLDLKKCHGLAHR